MPSAAGETVDHVQQKLNKILETRYDTDKVNKFNLHENNEEIWKKRHQKSRLKNENSCFTGNC